MYTRVWLVGKKLTDVWKAVKLTKAGHARAKINSEYMLFNSKFMRIIWAKFLTKKKIHLLDLMVESLRGNSLFTPFIFHNQLGA